MAYTGKGACLCGGVRFEASAPDGDVGLCHCKMCRCWAGGLPLAVLRAQVTLLAEGGLRWWRSSGWGERGFCGECGASLFWRAQGEAHNWAVSAGALENDGELQIVRHIFYDDKAAFYDTSDAAPRYGGAEFTARVLADIGALHGAAALQNALRQCREHAGDEFALKVEQLIKRDAAAG